MRLWIAGWICRRLGNGTTLLTGSASAIAALLLLVLTTSGPMIYASSFFRGVGDALIMAAAHTIASTLIPPEKRGRLFAWFNGTFFLSFGLGGALIAGPLVDGLISAGHPHGWVYQMHLLTLPV